MPALHAHARHSLKRSRDTTQPSTPPISFGNIYPRDDVIAVFEDRASADRALLAIIEAGIPEHDVEVADAEAVLQAHHEFRRRRGDLQRLQAWISTLFSDDAAAYASYIHEAEHGHALVIVHVASPDVLERVRQVLRACGAQNMRYYGALTITDL